MSFEPLVKGLISAGVGAAAAPGAHNRSWLERAFSPGTGTPEQSNASTALGNAGVGAGTRAAAQLLSHWSESGQSPSALAALGGASSMAMAAFTPRIQFEQQREQQVNRHLSPAEQKQPRWRELSPWEVAMAMLTGQGGGAKPQPGELGYTTSINGRSYRYDEVQENPADPTRIADLLGPQASQFHSRAFVTPRPKTDPLNKDEKEYQDVSVLNADGTTSLLSQNESGMVELPEHGFGFGTHHRNDVVRDGKAQKDQWGTPEMIANMMNISHDVHTLLPTQSLTFGDIATDTNKSPYLRATDNQTHLSHGQGNQVDLRYLSDDFSNNNLIRTAEEWGMNNFFYNPAKKGKYFFGEGSTTGTNADHADHLHMGIGHGGKD